MRLTVWRWRILFECRNCRAVAENGMRIQERVMADRDRYKGWLGDAWKAARQQNKGMNRMARKIKRLQAEVAALRSQSITKGDSQ